MTLWPKPGQKRVAHTVDVGGVLHRHLYVRMSSLYFVWICADEEIGGKNGMGEFVKTPFFAEMNVGFALDEGKKQMIWWSFH